MAFATRSLRVLCRIYNVNAVQRSTTYCTTRQPVGRISLIQSTQKYRYSIETTDRSKITSNLTNIQSSINEPESLGQEVASHKKQSEKQKEDEEEKANRERSKRMMNYGFAAFGMFMSIGVTFVIYELGRPNYDEHGNVIEDEFSNLPFFEQFYKRVKRELNYYTRLVQEPSREKLLPDPLKHPYIQPPYTLILEMTDLLVHPDWTYQTGWRFKKRPGVDQFLEAVAPPQFEIVIYTAEQGMTVFPILDALDPNGYIMYRLVRDATRFVDGHHVKDLGALNRDLSKVIVIDWNEESVKLHPENAFKLPRWTGNDDDTTLYDLAAFLKTILTSNVQDVRDVLNYYRQFDNPLEMFKENRRKFLQMQMEEEQNRQQDTNKVLTSRWKPSFLRNR
ncbi:mitochondrial import inner membrane translocase subunit TIM50-C-like isoform X1 [Monomorium pharaonis]|uniref:mitochondrial import inner membrane translocase subunit TIM50-C isoform X1 n=1 Tax=Monomorium pharaonis TaxID=307658 RepID=UPI00063EFCA5|nr:mitochondrial import inner membrane translocase subunit TIM50-C isoform X1 [Monomorium pharaonis]XP_036150689.1 mitochondrial import inner membrane translocase subunit TIM50-C-like isoform X1 [Monomorium pharaonis]